MNLVAALDVEQPANNRTPVAVTAAVVISNGRCIPPSVQTAEKKPKFPSVLAVTGPFTATTASEAKEVSLIIPQL